MSYINTTIPFTFFFLISNRLFILSLIFPPDYVEMRTGLYVFSVIGTYCRQRMALPLVYREAHEEIEIKQFVTKLVERERDEERKGGNIRVFFSSSFSYKTRLMDWNREKLSPFPVIDMEADLTTFSSLLLSFFKEKFVLQLNTSRLERSSSKLLCVTLVQCRELDMWPLCTYL